MRTLRWSMPVLNHSETGCQPLSLPLIGRELVNPSMIERLAPN